MMKRYLFTLLLLFAGTGLFAQNPTWADDIACIMYSHCTSCHHPDGAGPFSLVDYNDAAIMAPAIRNSVLSGSMPPWPPDQSYSRFAHERVLGQAEIDAIAAWVDAGTPQGNMSNAPVPPTYSNAPFLTNPTVSLRMDDYYVPPITADLYRCFVLDPQLSQDMYATSVEILPGNNSIVHHVLLFYDTTGTVAQLDSADPGPGYTSFGGVGVQSAKLVAGWVPGSEPRFTPAGMGLKIPQNATLVMQIHYPFGSSGQLDSTRVNLQLEPGPMREINRAPILNHVLSITNGPLFIPANTTQTFHQRFKVPVFADLTILDISPHAHLICESMKAFAVLPTGDTLPLVDIPEWDFHWQGAYSFQKPIKLPGGTELHGYATYNNTSSNPNNPSNPPQDVSVGEATNDEMMLFYFSYLLYQNGDEHIVVDTAAHPAHYGGCQPLNVGLEDEIGAGVALFPQPAKDQLNLSLGNGREMNFQLFDLQGRSWNSWEVSSGKNQLNIQGIPGGIYLGVLRDASGQVVLTRKLVLF